jgi:hypothetical protein
MAGDPKNPVLGELMFDLSEFAAFIVDLPPGACQGFLTTREGFLEVCQEFITNQAAFGALAGISDQEIVALETANARIERIDAFLPALLKAVEMLTETRYLLDDLRQRIVLDAATCVDRREKRNPEILARYERTRVYRSAIAKKGVKTRARNAAEATSPTLAVPPVSGPPVSSPPVTNRNGDTSASASEATPKGN